MSKYQELARENKECYIWIRNNGGLEFVNLAAECDAFARGEQWDQKTIATLRRRRKPHLTINKILATYSALRGEQIARGGDVSFRASSGGEPSTARVIDKLWLNFSQANNREWLEAEMFGDGIIRSRGFLDLRIDFDEAMRGEPKLTYLNSKDVGLYPGDRGYDPDLWTGVMVTRWLSARDISEIYGTPLDEVMVYADSPELESDYMDWRRDSFGTPMYDNGIISQDQRAKYRMLRVLERQEWEFQSRDCFVDLQTGEVREVPETWERERIQDTILQYGYAVTRRRVKKINWVVTVGNLTLHAAISPYKHFTPIPYFPFVIGGKPVGIVEQLRDPQNLLNKTLSQELHIVAGIANSGYKVRQGALSNMTTEQLRERGGEDGIVIEVNGDMSSVEKLKPNEVPTGLDRLSYVAGDVMAQISLVNSSMQGLNRADEAGKAIQRKAEQGSSALSPIFASLDHSRRIMARNWLDLVQEFVTEERVYHITTRAKTAETEQVTVNQEQWDGSFLNDLTVGEYMIQVTDVQSRDAYDQNQFDIMMQMIRMGAPLPWSEVINALTILENKDAIVEYLKGQEGQTDPSEEQKKQQAAQQRLLEAQALDKEASAAVKQAQAAKAGAEIPHIGKDKNPELELAKANQEAYLKQSEMQMKTEQQRQAAGLKQQEAEARLQLEAQRNQLELQKAQAEFQFLREKQALEMQFLREKNQIELEKLRATMHNTAMQSQLNMQAQREQAALTMQVKQQEAEHGLHVADAQAAQQREHAALQHQQQSEMENERRKAELSRPNQQDRNA